MRLLLAAILTLLPLPALADVTARYASGKDVVLVEVDAGGDSRIDIGGKFGIIRRAGVDYAIITTPAATKVIDFAELLSLMSGVLGDTPKPDAMNLEEKFLLRPGGDVSIAGRTGTLWTFGPEREKDGSPGKMLEFVMSADPALQPVAALFLRLIGTLKPVIGTLLPDATSFYPLALELAGKGAPLRIDKVELQSVDAAEIDPKRFDLPGPVVPAAEFLMVLEQRRSGGAPKP